MIFNWNSTFLFSFFAMIYWYFFLESTDQLCLISLGLGIFKTFILWLIFFSFLSSAVVLRILMILHSSKCCNKKRSSHTTGIIIPMEFHYDFSWTKWPIWYGIRLIVRVSLKGREIILMARRFLPKRYCWCGDMRMKNVGDWWWVVNIKLI